MTHSTPPNRRQALASIAGTLGVLGAPRVWAQQAYPDRPIKVIVGYPPGGIADILMRAAGAEAEKKLGQPLVVENRQGAVVSFLAIKNAKPDGYTVGVVNTALWRQPVLEDVAYDPIKDFTYIINMADNVFAVVVSADSPFQTWADLLAWGRTNAEKVSYGAIPGLGQSGHVFMEQVTGREKLKWQPIPYRGSSDGMPALLSQQLTFSVDTLIGTSALARAGKLRYLAVASDRRLKSFPNVPTMQELGYPLKIDSPTGLGGPAGMPPQVVKALHDAFKFALEQPSVVAILDRADQSARYLSTEDYSKFVVHSEAEQRELLTRFGFAKKR